MKRTFILIFVIAFIFTACKKDEIFTLTDVTINTDNYTMGGDVSILFSTDGGASFSKTFPKIEDGDGFVVKFNNGTEDLSFDDFDFDWTGSSITPDVSNAQKPTFKVTNNVTLKVKISDKVTLVAAERFSGKWVSVNETTGAKTDLYTPTLNSAALKALRGFTFHTGLKKFFVTQTSNEGGKLLSIDPKTHVATVINANSGTNGAVVWDAVVNWTVVENDSLLGYGDFNNDGNGLVKFATNGGRGKIIPQDNLCCGLGMLFDNVKKEIIVANNSDADDGQAIFDKLTYTGSLSTIGTISTFEGFPINMALEWHTVKALAQHNGGTIYGIVYPNDTDASYFAKIDLTSLKITYISTLGTDANNLQFNMLTYIPNYAL